MVFACGTSDLVFSVLKAGIVAVTSLTVAQSQFQMKTGSKMYDYDRIMVGLW